jgi:hypothetical protein
MSNCQALVIMAQCHGAFSNLVFQQAIRVFPHATSEEKNLKMIKIYFYKAYVQKVFFWFKQN